MYICLNMNICVHIFIFIYICTYLYTDLCIYIYIYIYIYISTAMTSVIHWNTHIATNTHTSTAPPFSLQLQPTNATHPTLC